MRGFCQIETDAPPGVKATHLPDSRATGHNHGDQLTEQMFFVFHLTRFSSDNPLPRRR